METKEIIVCDCVHYDVSCVENDSVDIRCGGPAILGYDFYVSADENVDNVKTFLRKCIEKYDRPFMSISHRIVKDFSVEKLWTRERMEDCIKKNAIIKNR